MRMKDERKRYVHIFKEYHPSVDSTENTQIIIGATPNGSENTGHWNNKKYGKLLNKTGVTLDVNKRKKLYNELEKQIDKSAPVSPIYQAQATRLVKPYVQGLPMNDALNFVYTKDLYLTKHS